MAKKKDDIALAQRVAAELRNGPASPPKAAFLKKKPPEKKEKPPHGGYYMFALMRCPCYVCTTAKAKYKAPGKT